jgi:hypothetical protein
MIDRRPNAPDPVADPDHARRPSHPRRYVVAVGCERLGRLVLYGLPGETKPPKFAYGDFPCPCGQTHLGDALPRPRRRSEVADVELETPPLWHKRWSVVQGGSDEWAS